MMQKWGLGEQVTLIGVGEAVSALLFLILRTHSLGLLLLTAYMGGAIVTHMQHGESYVLAVGYSGLDLGCRFSSPPPGFAELLPEAQAENRERVC